MSTMIKSALAALTFLIAVSPVAGAAREIDLSKINVPEGFEVSLYADRVPQARSMTMGDKGTLFVSTRGAGALWALEDTDKDGVADERHQLARKLNMPNGIVFRDGSLYVAEVSRITRYDNIEDKLENVPEPVVLYDQLPTEGTHGWKYLEFGPDGKLYFNVGSPCNRCDRNVTEDERFATIMRINADGSEPEIFVRGIRQSVGFDWHPADGALWFTDNGADNMGDDRPDCELNRATEKDQHFGFPFCHGGDIVDDELESDKDCDDFIAPALKLGAHVTPLGCKFYTGTQFPGDYNNALFIAQHGSTNRTIPQGYEVVVVRSDKDGNVIGSEVFADGWLERGKAWGRPVDVLVLEDGSLLLSDDMAGVVYKFTYTK